MSLPAPGAGGTSAKTLKIVVRSLIEAEKESKLLKARLKTLRSTINDAKTTARQWMEKKNVSELNAGRVRLLRKTSKRLPALNRDFIEESLKIAADTGIKEASAIVEFMFTRRTSLKITTEVLSVRHPRTTKRQKIETRPATTTTLSPLCESAAEGTGDDAACGQGAVVGLAASEL